MFNYIFIGLKIVCDDFDTKSNDVDAGHQEMLLDVQSACRIAVEILNDLLCFDKLESGILELHKQDIEVAPFIASCVKMFASQAKEEGVTIVNTTERSFDHSLMELDNFPILDCRLPSAILDNDVVVMDKFKMDQVLRNLISNALKFTPRGGSVTVSAFFIPDESSTISSPCEPNYADMRQSGRTRPMQSYLQFPSLRAFGWKKSNASTVSEATEDDLESALESITHNTSSSPHRSTHTRLLDHFYSPISRQLKKSFSSKSRSDRDSVNNNIWQLNESGSDRSNDDTFMHGKLRIVVADTGVGISEENQARLFKEVVQFNPEVLQAGGGSGLGLWITSNIVQMHGGTIHAYSAGLGKGTTLTVELGMTRHRLVKNLLSKIDLRDTSSESARSARHEEVGARPGRALGLTIDIPKNSSHRSSQDKVSMSPTPATVTTSATTSATSIAASPTHFSNGHSLFRSNSDPVQTSDRLTSRPLDVFGTSVSTLTATTIDKMKGDVEMEADSKGVDSASEGGFDVLVVDDSGLNRKMLCKLLRTVQCTMEEADDGLKAVERVKARMAQGIGSNRMYDAILMDFVMPNMDGPSATHAIRALGYSGPILGVTGNTLESDVIHFVKCGANAVLAKPFDLNQFMELMKQYKSSVVDLSDVDGSVEGMGVIAPPGRSRGTALDIPKNSSHSVSSSTDNVSLTAATATATPATAFSASATHFSNGHSLFRSNSDPVQTSDRLTNRPLDVFSTSGSTLSASIVNMSTNTIGPAGASISEKMNGDVKMEADSKGVDGASEGGFDVLVVDDSGLNRKMLCKLLRTVQCTMEEADDGLKAVERVKARMAQGIGSNRMYDAILMDFVMPNMDGPSATHAIRALGYSGPILGVTGNTLESDVIHFVKCGANAVLAKPFDLNQFMELMKQYKS